MIGTVLVVLLILILVGALPRWPYSKDWGNGPAGVISLVLVVLLIVVLLGYV